MRHSTGHDQLDEMLGGGLLPGALTVVVGATGIGKTQLGIAYADAGQQQESRRGIIFDMTARGDSQSHDEYAERIAGWPCTPFEPPERAEMARLLTSQEKIGDYLRAFDMQGRRVGRRDLEPEDWDAWRAELTRRLNRTIAFFYANFAGGVRRAVIDGIEPTDRPAESIQLELFEYIYHQILRKDCEWVARDLFREQFRAHAELIHRRRYASEEIGCLALCTSHEAMLEDLISRPLDEGDLLAGANTLILMGKIREGSRMRRALYIAKHRGSRCSDDIVPYEIDQSGLQFGGE